MASLYIPSVTVIFSIWVMIISPAYSLTCTSQKLNNNNLYQNCIDLPTLNSYLHYTYDATNSSLSIAFVSTPAKPDGWVAWAINPTAKGMIGSQALIALKSSNGSLVVKTYNISSYAGVAESNLSFETWDLKAQSVANGTTVIYGKLKVPEKAESLNQVWQVGAQVTGGHPVKHEILPANLKATGPLNLVQKPGDLTPSAAPTSGGPAPDKAGQSMIRANNNVGLFLGLVLFLGCFFAL